MATMRLILFSVTTLVLASGCGSGSDADPYTDADPRCAAVCAIDEPAVEGAGDVCSEDSAAACVDQCEARIVDVSTVCATCLLEETSFGDEVLPGSHWCDGDTLRCTIEGRNGSCNYSYGDQAGLENCLRQVYPRREVDCDVDFRPVNDCAEVCAAAPPQGSR